MTAREALQWADAKLRASGGDPRFDAPMLDAEILLGASLHMPRGAVLLREDAQVHSIALEKFQGFVRRRSAHEPIAFILGMRAFYGRPFAVNRHTLIPRPSTETLVDAAIALAKKSGTEKVLFADIGTGSGAIALTLAKETGLPVIASDISRQALAIARRNVRSHAMAKLVDFRLGRGLRPLVRFFASLRGSTKQSPPYDHLILCANLPYLPKARWEELQIDIRLYEPKIALVSGQDGLEIYREFFRNLREHRDAFPSRLSCIIEIDPTQSETAPALIRQHFPVADIEIGKDLEGFERMVIFKTARFPAPQQLPSTSCPYS